MGSNPGEDMDACKCIVPLRQGGTLNSRRAASPLVWLVEQEERYIGRDTETFGLDHMRPAGRELDTHYLRCTILCKNLKCYLISAAALSSLSCRTVSAEVKT
ncbi:hypothetical protein TNCV_2256571 [Trichonephila clavipes]|nr:hypothetical protein TNCV_2256571 [Trichonephila clavipes]